MRSAATFPYFFALITACTASCGKSKGDVSTSRVHDAADGTGTAIAPANLQNAQPTAPQKNTQPTAQQTAGSGFDEPGTVGIRVDPYRADQLPPHMSWGDVTSSDTISKYFLGIYDTAWQAGKAAVAAVPAQPAGCTILVNPTAACMAMASAVSLANQAVAAVRSASEDVQVTQAVRDEIAATGSAVQALALAVTAFNAASKIAPLPTDSEKFGGLWKLGASKEQIRTDDLQHLVNLLNAYAQQQGNQTVSQETITAVKSFAPYLLRNQTIAAMLSGP